MLNLFSMSAFVQFIGAFHFANVYSPIQKKLFEHFLKVEEEFESAFRTAKEKVQADMQSVKSMSVIKTTDGLSTQSSVSELSNRLFELQQETSVLYEKTKHEIEERFTMGYSRPMFMTFGLYCTFELFVFGLLDSFKSDDIMASFSIYNSMMWIVLFYFAVCEVCKMFRRHHKFFSPSHWGMMLVSFFIAFVCVMNYLFVTLITPVMPLPYVFTEWMSASCIILSVLPFVFVMFLTFIHYKASMKLIRNNTSGIIEKHEELHKMKQKLDDICALFTKSDNEFNFE